MTNKLTIVTNNKPNAEQRVRDNLKGRAGVQCYCGSRTYTFIYTGTLKQRICVMCFMNKRIVEM
jgi:hypothetical protein